MNTRSLVGCLVATAWLLLGTVDAWAQAACVRNAPAANAIEAFAHVEALTESGCLGGPQCDSQICKSTLTLLNASSPPADQVSLVLRDIFAVAAGGNSEPRHRLWARMSLTIEQYVREHEAAAAAWRREELTFFKDDADFEIDVETFVTACDSPAACAQASADAQTVIELATLFGRVLTKANEAGRNQFARRLEQLDTQWRAYLSSSRGQYPWELLLNSALYRKTAQFDAPPAAQWIFAHPGAAYELTANSADRQPSEVLLVELIGRYRWTWSENKMVQRFGGSLTLAWRDAGEGRKKLGYGALVYLPRQSTVGYVWRPQKDHPDEHVLLLSADLVKFVRGTQGIKERLLGTR